MFPAISRDATYSRPVCGESFCILWLQNDGAYRLSAQFSLNQQAVWGGKLPVGFEAKTVESGRLSQSRGGSIAHIRRVLRKINKVAF